MSEFEQQQHIEAFGEKYELSKNVLVKITEKRWQVLYVPKRGRHKNAPWLTNTEYRLLAKMSTFQQLKLMRQLELRIQWIKMLGERYSWSKRKTRKRYAIYEKCLRALQKKSFNIELEKKRRKIMAKLVTDKVTLKALAATRARGSGVSDKLAKELKQAMAQPSKWFVLDATYSSTMTKKVVINHLKQPVKKLGEKGKGFIVRRLGVKRKNKKVIDRGHVYVRFDAS